MKAEGHTRDLVLLVDRLILGLTRHWLVLFNLAVGLYVGLPLLAPVLMHLGYQAPGRLIYTLYIPNCHQLPERSFFLFGEQMVYDLGDLPPQAQGPTQASACTDCLLGRLPVTSEAAVSERLPRRYFYGDSQVGYKVAFCQRDTAIYGAMFLAGLLYGPLRRQVRPLPFLYFLILSVPLAVDGGAQLLGLWESNWLNRVLSGSLFGVAAVWLAYPYVQMAMDELRQDLEPKVRRAGP